MCMWKIRDDCVVTIHTKNCQKLLLLPLVDGYVLQRVVRTLRGAATHLYVYVVRCMFYIFIHCFSFRTPPPHLEITNLLL